MLKNTLEEIRIKLKEYMKDYYIKNKNRLLKKAVEYRSKLNPEKQKEYMHKYYLEHKPKLFKQQLKYYYKTPGIKIKIRARKRALRRYKKLPLCQICKKVQATERHHLDYKKPYKIIFCCEKCHKNIHRKYNNILNPRREI